MQNSTLIKLLAGLTGLIFVAVAVLNFWKLNVPETMKTAPAFTKAGNYSASGKPFVPKVVKPKPESDGNTEPDLNEKAAPKLSRKQAEAWLAKHNRNAMSLLAAFRAMGDTNYLNEAATNFPNDPHVELAVLAHDEFPADRRKWLDLFKASSPSNSLANYLSAQDYFKNGDSAAAIQELQAASGKNQFEMFETESGLDAQDLYLSSGQSELESLENSRFDFSGESLSNLAGFKRLAQSIGDLQQQYINANDPNSAAALAALGMSLANQLQTGEGSKSLINQLVGFADTKIVLSKLDQNTAYDFLNGQTPAQISDQLKQQKMQLIQITKAFGDITPDLTDAEKISFRQREIIFGETAAMKWAVQQHPVPTYPLPASQ